MSGRTPTARALGVRRGRIAGHGQTRAFLTWLVSSFLWLLRRSAGFAIGFATLGLAVFGVFREPGHQSAPQLLALAGLSALLLARLFERLSRRSKVSLWADVELGTLFIASAFALIEITGGPSGLLYPLVFALVAFLVAFHPLRAGLYFLGLIIVTEALIFLMQPDSSGWKLFASHASFLVLFGFLYAVFLRSEVATGRTKVQRDIDTHLQAISAEANEFRLTSALSFEARGLNAAQLRQRRQISSVRAIRDSLYNVLGVAERALRPHTVALFWMDADDRHLRLKELRSQSDHVQGAPIASGEGLLGAIGKRREPLVLSQLKSGHPGLVYYRRPPAVTDFAGVPVQEGSHLRGVLVADRVDGRPFDDSEISVLTTIADEIVRVVQVERIFADMDRDKYQREQFYEASRAFNSSLTLDQVARVAIGAARRVAHAEFAAVAVATDTEGVLEIVAAEDAGDDGAGETLVGQFFNAEAGLVGTAIKARHPLPHGTARGASQKLFGDAQDVEYRHVKVLPLLWKNIGVGALVLGSEQEDFLSLDQLDMVKVIADHAAIAIANAQMYERMERMATTDGLTGLVNHRYFQELFDDMMARGERYGRAVSVILTDIDHFKSINDTYGHPVGDMVLKRVSKLLGESARRTDVVARYGGEEFAVLMEETDAEGAFQIAERIRTAVEAETFRCETGTFQCTLSLGIATFPEDAQHKAKLTECADQALYQAKRSGRNRSIRFKASA